MDPKKQGVVFEALTFIALEDLGFEVHWGEKPEGFGIDPDFVLGPLEAPTHWVLVTSTGSAKNFDMKFWRNVSEIFLAKRFFETPPKVVDLVFKENQKKGLQEAMRALADGDLRVGDHEFGADLIAFIDALPESQVPGDNQQKAAFLRDRLAKDAAAQATFKAFKATLQTALQQEKPELAGLWRLLRDRDRTHTPKAARTTTLRRGVVKLMLFPEDVRQRIYGHLASGNPIPLPAYAVSLGLANPGIIGGRITDDEIRGAVALLGADRVEEIIARSPRDKMLRWIEPLQNLGNVEVQLDYVRKHYDELVTSEGMLRHLQAQYADPYNGLDQHLLGGGLRTVWLFYFAFNLAKVHSGKKQGFGLSQLGVLAQDFLEAGSYPPNNRAWTIVASDFANRIGAETMPEEVLSATSAVLAGLIQTMGGDGLQKAAKDLESMVITSNLEQRLIPYRLFGPLPSLLEVALSEAGISYRRLKSHPSALGEAVGSAKSATTTVIRTENAILHWKTAVKNSRDKTKELAGRAEALRYIYDGSQFVERPGVDRLVLLLDGSFTQSEIDALLEAGWDSIYYPDEIDALVASLA